MNPCSEICTDFSPDEIDSLLKEGTIFTGAKPPGRQILGAEFQIKEPHIHMPLLEIALTTVFSDYPAAEKAFLLETVKDHNGKSRRALTIVLIAQPSKSLVNAIRTIFSDVYNGPLPVDLYGSREEAELIEKVLLAGGIAFYDRTNFRGPKQNH